MTAARFAVLLVVGLCLCGQQVRSACVTLSWTATGDDGVVGTASYYDIRFSKEAITEENWSLATPARVLPIPKPSGVHEEWLVSGLEPGVRYYFAVKAGDEYRNWSGISNVIAKRAPVQICNGLVGNVNCDPNEVVDLSDLIALVNYLFLNGQICNPGEANANGDPYGTIDISDLMLLVDHLFRPPASLPSCL